jgi:hypothetical protein
MALKLIIGFFSITMACFLPFNAFAATDSTSIGISVVVKETQNCQFQFLPLNNIQSAQTQFSNCDFKSKELQQSAEQAALQIDQKLILNEQNEKQLRVVMTIQ